MASLMAAPPEVAGLFAGAAETTESLDAGAPEPLDCGEADALPTELCRRLDASGIVYSLVAKNAEVIEGHVRVPLDSTMSASVVLVGANQLDVQRADIHITAADLLEHPQGDITLDGVCSNVKVALDYTAAWLAGRGCVPLNHLMEDAATAEIARAQLWQWVHHANGICRNGQRITESLVGSYIDHVLRDRLKVSTAAESRHYREAARLLRELTAADTLADFLTLPAYENI